MVPTYIPYLLHGNTGNPMISTIFKFFPNQETSFVGHFEKWFHTTGEETDGKKLSHSKQRYYLKENNSTDIMIEREVKMLKHNRKYITIGTAKPW